MRRTIILSSFLFYPLVCGVIFVDICQSDSGHKCCDSEAGMEFSQYWIMRMPMSWVDQELECRIEEAPNTQLVVFETRAEMDCLIKYLTDEFPDQAAAKYAIGLQEPDEYRVGNSVNVNVNICTHRYI